MNGIINMKIARRYCLTLGLAFFVFTPPFLSFAQIKPSRLKENKIFSTPAFRPAWVNSQAQSSEPTLVILSYFPDTDRDVFAKTTQDDWARLFFGSKPSIKNYFEKVSFNKVSFVPAADTDSQA
ncbi:hypothetical protein L0244_04480, partial [bacterium]|nr:hypothetical protein [bacterium]